MEKELLIEPHYLGSIEYFVLISKYSKIRFEVCEHFQKQTYRNRCYVLGANGPLQLSVPVSFGNRTPYKDVKIDYSQQWVKDHMRAVSSGYGKAAYFEHFYELFAQVWKKKPVYLLDLNIQMMTICLSILHLDRKFSYTTSFDKVPEINLIDARNLISAKKSYKTRGIYQPKPYFQNFGADFVPNLSLLDLLMCEGVHSIEVIRNSDS